MRFVDKVAVWPVGFAGRFLSESPIINSTSGKVIGFNSQISSSHPFPIDMAGFAINLQYLLRHEEAEFSYDVPIGFQESTILLKLIAVDELEPKAENCTKVGCVSYDI